MFKLSTKDLKRISLLGLLPILLMVFFEISTVLEWAILTPLLVIVPVSAGVLLKRQWNEGKQKLVKQKLWRVGFFIALSVGIFIYFLN